jgi:lysophospholipase L1-like esterase
MNGRQARGCGMSAHDRTKTITKKTANSIVGKLTAGILAAVAVFLLLLAPSAAASVILVGDSLEVGSAPHLRAALGGTPVEIDAEKGRTSSQGVGVLADRLRPEHEVVVFPLGTNDLSADAFATSLASVAQLAQGRCVVVATIVRRQPPASELNRVVASFAATGEAQVADWRAAAAAPGVLGRDGTHATGAGYALRASLLAEAVRGCLVGGGASGIPAPENPDVQVPRGEQRDAGRPGRAAPPARPVGPRARPVRLPVRRALVGLALALRRAVSPVVAALRDARTAATKAEPEPVLGAP